ncbi:MAG: hypothetical protein ACREO6_07555 [Rudaea sp.]
MRKLFIFRGVQALLIALLLAMLAACGGRDAINKGTSDVAVANSPTTFDMTVAADADSQFEYQGATLTREDLAGHIRYLAETGKPVHSILLTTGEKQKIKNEHVAALASICRDLKITGYVRDNDGHLKVIQIVK